MANIKGFAVRGLLKYAKEKEPGSIPQIVAQLPPHLAVLFDRPVLVSQWYPYETFSQLLRILDRRFGSGDLTHCVEIGHFAAANDFSGIFKAAMNLFSPGLLLGRGNIFWSKYCDTGRFVSSRLEANSFAQRLEDFPGIDQAQCYVLIGFIRKFGELVNARNVDVHHNACVHRGDPYCEWEGTWVE